MRTTEELEIAIEGLESWKYQYEDHQHTGVDSQYVRQLDLSDRKFYISHTIAGVQSATATNYGVFFIAPFECYVSKVQEVHLTAGSDGSAVTLMIEKLTSAEAPGSGDDVLSTALSLKTTANTVQSGIITATKANSNLEIGDRLCMEDTGTLTAVANVTVLIELTIKKS